MSKAEAGAGDVEITLVGKGKVTLRPGLEACIALTTDPKGLFGGDGSIYDRIGKLDIAVMARVIRLGTGTGASGVKDLEECMYKTGLAFLRDPLWEYIGNVVSGGRKQDEEGSDSPPEEKASA